MRKNAVPIEETRLDGINAIDVVYSARHRNKERHSLIQYIRPYLRPYVFAIFDWKDSRPFVQRSSNLAKSAIQAALLAKKRQSFRHPDTGGEHHEKRCYSYRGNTVRWY